MEELIIKEREFKKNIVEVINQCNLPAFIIKPIIKELFEQVNILEEKQYEEAQASKEKEEKKEENGNGNEKDNI